MLRKLSLILLAACVILLASGCNSRNNIQASDYIIYATFQKNSFTAINIGGFWDVVFRQAESHSVAIEMSDNLFEYLNIEVQNGVLHATLNTRRGVGIEFGNAGNPLITVYSPYISELNLSGFSNAIGWDTITAQNFTLNASGFVNININLDVETLNMDASGSSTIQLSGYTNVADITLSGFGTISAFNLQTQDARVIASGSSNINIAVSEYLNATAEGFSNVQYRGNPIVTQRTTGASNVRAED